MQAGNMYHMAQLQRMSAKAGDAGLIPGSGRSPGEGNDNLFQYSCLGNPIDRGAWRAAVHGVIKSRTQLSMHSCIHKGWLLSDR